jgi:protease secretion system membrane fusion protein
LQSALQEPAVQPHLQVQTQLFESRKSSFDANQAGLRANLAGLLAQREGGARMLTQRQRQLALFNEELGNIQELVKEGYAPRNRALELQRSLADTSSTIADLESNDQKIQRSIDEMKQRLEQGRAGFQAEVAAQLAEVRRDVQSDAEKLQAVSQDMEHIDIRSPASGQVVGLSVQTVGAVIGPGQRLMDIVPEGAPLVVEARIPPHIVDRVKPGLQADVRFSAFAHSPQLTVAGTVQSVSQDVLADPDTRQSYFLARIQLTPEGLAVLGPRTMQAGMSAEVVIRTGERTVLQYLLHPLVRRLAQSMKEE